MVAILVTDSTAACILLTCFTTMYGPCVKDQVLSVPDGLQRRIANCWRLAVLVSGLRRVVGLEADELRAALGPAPVNRCTGGCSEGPA